ncbi:tail fiber assembly protein [Rouxiella badensis]|uniref:tail fiber assembly protein n=1 Tax=Rouxiella badensis TaxID=1646377 RepID=UPI001D13801D|nr:tail fiber assembly protein [Rouxiella badensis]MCC3745336.1 tail fiber assembly protein [Rouxiella badensis]
MYFTRDYGFTPNSISEFSVEISDERWEELIKGQSNGKVILYDEKGFPNLGDPIVLNHEQMIYGVEQKKNYILQEITNKTQIWQTQLALGIITDANKVMLTLWMDYARKIIEIDSNDYHDINWPTSP